MWWALGVAGAALIAVLALAFNRSSLAKRLGESDEKNRGLEEENRQLRAALASRSAADPDLDDLDGMFDESADVPS